jgi:uncharacterized membrane protein
VPSATGWLGENHEHPLPVALCGTVLFFAGVAYFILQNAIIARQDPDSTLRRAVGNDGKGKLSNLLKGGAIPLAFVSRWASLLVYVVVALIWLVPDPRIERRLER